MQQFAEIVFPTAVRHPFTYAVPEKFRDQITVGTRVWVPLQKHKSIGMVVAIHDQKPDFRTRPIEKLLDEQPILSDELLKLTRWIHRFYYCGWGEVIQTALPVGLNFYSEKYLQVNEGAPKKSLNKYEQEIFEEISQQQEYLHDEARKRWSEGRYKKAFNSLINKGEVEVWERPAMKMKPQTEKQWDWQKSLKEVDELVQEYVDAGKEYKWIEALKELRDIGLPKLQNELIHHELLEYYTLNRIAEEGLIKSEEVEVTSTIEGLEYEPSKIKTLNKRQKQAFEKIREPLEEGEFSSFLLYGVTGSGKTEVYIHALKKALKLEKGGIVLVPEISLTPQTVKRFYQIFGDTIAVLHSGLTDRERYNAWQELRKGEKKIAIGARSAIFAPVQNVGLIIVDEEHDASYKQTDPAPRYHGRDVAIMRAYLNDAVVVMGSATPSMNVLYNAQKEKSTMLTLPNRHKGATLPEVHVVDLKQYRSAMKGPLAVSLHNAIEQALDKGEQVILLHNRRGFSSFLQCEDCGSIPECPNCSVSLTYHKIKDTLRCHYCGFSKKIPNKCGFCNGNEVKQQGIGTQQVENELAKLFPDASISRMDRDTTSAKGSHERILSSFGDGAIDILVGTQLVAKGLDFPNVTVVGVINADTELAFPSFRSAERMYQLLSQVSGRSGRADKKGEVYLQTWQSDHFAIQCARQHDHRKFARQEMAKRKDLYYPPYSRIVAFQFKSRDSQKVAKVAHAFTRCLREIAGQYPVLGPSPAAITKMQGFIRWESMLKLDPELKTSEIEYLLHRTFKYYDQQKPKGTSAVRINVDVDAIE
ncbi:primosomal protein N' [Aliifodinibius sp. S!AR15-10]|uniref:replication restart helicase PriA n=1 Tax=Aliifodinibius sp. S!AR15-10 TaxID=2950437 RepID=UPI00285B098E|nr:primosomal protein N' [Aliifodinibius sp. S!AR15-10]MDR8392829.1 primosomal protein N' [Aliifodinibius sp. S!AR15-10]